jgi:hypothetical protein
MRYLYLQEITQISAPDFARSNTFSSEVSGAGLTAGPAQLRKLRAMERVA